MLVAIKSTDYGASMLRSGSARRSSPHNVPLRASLSLSLPFPLKIQALRFQISPPNTNTICSNSFHFRKINPSHDRNRDLSPDITRSCLLLALVEEGVSENQDIIESMSNHYSDQLENIETTCGSLLCELKKIWDEVGEPEDDRDKMLLEIEQECLRIYLRKVDEAKECRAKLQREIDVAEVEISDICTSLDVKLVNVSGITMRKIVYGI
ncbi:hypothetical protein SLEP1_g24017 [Rubroshorea leprosula]|uniref:Uncharacterized protein n=1 Tax=Rubroshorea leprosula TaxID=152421 RepID=A0AAV5JLJ5_9ROSI|nr:hypothetical protein SLEP1_g24017 [Rubroshorea leprosula]